MCPLILKKLSHAHYTANPHFSPSPHCYSLSLGLHFSCLIIKMGSWMFSSPPTLPFSNIVPYSYQSDHVSPMPNLPHCLYNDLKNKIQILSCSTPGSKSLPSSLISKPQPSWTPSVLADHATPQVVSQSTSLVTPAISLECIWQMSMYQLRILLAINNRKAASIYLNK